MIQFAVHHDDMKHDQGTWVLAVDAEGERLLLANGEDGSLYWRAIKDCRLVKVQTPDMPQAVMAVQPNQQVVLPPSLNGLRRN